MRNNTHLWRFFVLVSFHINIKKNFNWFDFFLLIIIDIFQFEITQTECFGNSICWSLDVFSLEWKSLRTYEDCLLPLKLYHSTVLPFGRRLGFWFLRMVWISNKKSEMAALWTPHQPERWSNCWPGLLFLNRVKFCLFITV